jgi:uncharacterized protein YjbI with pentapeptide repeats
MDTEELLELYEEGERDFQGLDLEESCLNKANLTNADLSDTDLSYVNLSFAILKNAYLPSTLSGVNLSDADLSGVNLSDADLSGADLRDANLSGADLSGADLSRADLSGADLNLANLTGTIIDKRTKIDHKWIIVWKILNKERLDQISEDHENQISLFDIPYLNLKCIDLSNSFLKDAKLVRFNLTNADFSNSNLHSADLRRANLTGANLTGVNLQEATLIEANLQGANLSNADLRYANIQGVDLTYTKMDGAKLLTSDISDHGNQLDADISCPWNQLDADKFEELCYDIIKVKHNPIKIYTMGKSNSPDGGIDIEFYKSTGTNNNEIIWIAQCKLRRDGKSLTAGQVQDIRDMLEDNNATGFCIMTSGCIGASLHKKLNKLTEKNRFEV